MYDNICNELISGAKEVFTMMLMVDIEPGVPETNQLVDMASNLTSMLGLGGDIKGMLAIHCTCDAAKNITGTMLGMEVTTLDDDVKDAVGEIANMVAGNLKISFDKLGINIELAIPSSIIGDSYKMGRLAGSNYINIPCTIMESEFWIELRYISN